LLQRQVERISGISPRHPSRSHLQAHQALSRSSGNNTGLFIALNATPIGLGLTWDEIKTKVK